MQQAIINATIHNGSEVLQGATVVTNDGVIVAVQTQVPENCETVDTKGYHLTAGFIDLHINGGEQFYFTQTPTEEAIHDVYTSGLQYGTTHVLPCLITSDKENILAGIEAIKNYRNKYNNGVLGMHLEGPFISPAKRGAHLATLVRKPQDAELEEIIRYGKGVIKLITIAPECFTDNQLDMLLESGIVVSAGHSNMTYRQAQHYFAKGITLVTHLYNAMTQFGHREPGLVGASLLNDTVFTPVILDGHHCDYAAARLAYTMKKDKFILISDALFLSEKVTRFNWGQFDATLQNGQYRNSEGNLAGSAISMADAVRNAVRELNVPIGEAVKMANTRVAQALKMDDVIGKIAPGYPATFVQFNNDLSVIKPLLL